MSIEKPEEMLVPTFGAGDGLGEDEEHIFWEPEDAAKDASDIPTPSSPSRWRKRTKEEGTVISHNDVDGLSSPSEPGDQAPSPSAAESVAISMTRLRDAVRGTDKRGLDNPQSTEPKALTQLNVRPKLGGAEIVSHPETPMPLHCPICGKELAVDNDGLNAHIDYCLSRGTIMKAASGS